MFKNPGILAVGFVLGVLPLRVEAANSGLFYDYAAAYIGYAKSVQIGDVNGDGLVDVALTTWNTDDPALDYNNKGSAASDTVTIVVTR